MDQFLTGDAVGLLDRVSHHVASEDFNFAIDIFGPLAQFEWELVKVRTMAGLAAARVRGRTGGRPTVMTTAKIRAAQRMISADTPLTEVASVLGVGRATLYRRLQETSPTAWFSSPTEGGTAVPYDVRVPVRKTVPGRA